jgi:hypothetical protein
MKAGKTLMNIVIIGLLVIILLQVMGRGVSGFDLVTTPGKGLSSGPSSIYGLKHDVKCTASGFNPDSAYYSKSLTPGGWCGDMDFVRNQERDFTIENIGGSLLAK